MVLTNIEVSDSELWFVDSNWSLINIILWNEFSFNIIYFAQCKLKFNKTNTEAFCIWVDVKRICVDFPITMLQVNLSKEKNAWTETLKYNELFMKQETPNNNHTKLAFHVLWNKK